MINGLLGGVGLYNVKELPLKDTEEMDVIVIGNGTEPITTGKMTFEAFNNIAAKATTIEAKAL